jgi:hypothetical protein
MHTHKLRISLLYKTTVHCEISCDSSCVVNISMTFLMKGKKEQNGWNRQVAGQ